MLGELGWDVPTGGADADNFYFGSLADSGLTAAIRDSITDFEDGVDHFELSAIAAKTNIASGTNDAFTVVGTNVSSTGTAGVRGGKRLEH